MNPDVIYTKTAKGLEEMTKRTFKLPARMRSLLIMIDGKVAVAGLISKSASPDEAAAYVAALLNDGFIEPKGIGPTEAAKATSLPIGVDSLDSAKRFVIHSLENALGPDADLFTGKVELATSIAELAQLAPKHAEVIRGMGGARKTESFVRGLIENHILTAEASVALMPVQVAPPQTLAPGSSAAKAVAPKSIASNSAFPASVARATPSVLPNTNPSLSPGANPSSGNTNGLNEAKQTIVRYLRDALGPDADQFTGKVEAITSISELRLIAQKYGDVIKVASGSRKAEEFHQRVSSALA